MLVLKNKHTLAFPDKYRLLVCLQKVRLTENIYDKNIINYKNVVIRFITMHIHYLNISFSFRI